MRRQSPLGVSRYTVGGGLGAGRTGAVRLPALSLATPQGGAAKRM